MSDTHAERARILANDIAAIERWKLMDDPVSLLVPELHRLLREKRELRKELARFQVALLKSGGLAKLTICPSCLVEWKNGERHEHDCPVADYSQIGADGRPEGW